MHRAHASGPCIGFVCATIFGRRWAKNCVSLGVCGWFRFFRSSVRLFMVIGPKRMGGSVV